MARHRYAPSPSGRRPPDLPAWGLQAAALLVFAAACTDPEASTAEAPAPSPASTEQTAAISRLDLRIAPFTDFYFLVRAQAGGVVEPSAQLQPIVDAWMPVQEEIGSFGGFWRFDLAGLFSASPGEFAESFSDAPETVPSRRGGEIPIRGPGMAMSKAMETAWPAFLEEQWPSSERQLREAIRRLEQDFMPRHQEALHHMLASLGIDDPGIALPTWLALEIHRPGASTYRAEDGPVLVLSIRDLLAEGRFGDLTETLLHETCHALDLASDGEGDAFSRMRRLLEQKGIDRSDRRWRDVPHLIMFVQAENTIRRLFDPQHVAYGDTWRGDVAPLYERSGPIAEVVRNVWGHYLDGDLDMEEALERIVAEA